MSWIPILVCVAIAALAVWTTWLDWRTGEIGMRRQRGRPRSYLRRSEYPLVFITFLLVRIGAATLLILLFSGWLFTWLGFR